MHQSRGKKTKKGQSPSLHLMSQAPSFVLSGRARSEWKNSPIRAFFVFRRTPPRRAQEKIKRVQVEKALVNMSSDDESKVGAGVPALPAFPALPAESVESVEAKDDGVKDWTAFVADGFFPTSVVSFETANPAGTIKGSPISDLYLALIWNHGRLFLANRSVPSVQVLDAKTLTPITSIAVVTTAAVDIISAPPPYHRVYVSHQLSGQISVISSEQLTVLGVVALGTNINRMAISPNGKYLFVMADAGGSVMVLDALTNPALPALVTTIVLPPGVGTPWFTPDGTLCFISAGSSSVISVVDVATLAVVNTINLPAGSGPFGMTILPNSSLLFSANVQNNTVAVVNVASQTLVSVIPLAAPVSGPFWSVCTPDSKQLFVIDENSNIVQIDTRTLVAGAPVTTSGIFEDIIMSPELGKPVVFLSRQVSST